MKTPEERASTDLDALSALAPELAEMLVSVAGDVALIVDAEGTIERIALGGGEPMRTMADDWLGRRLIDTVTHETRRKVEQLLADVSATGLSRARQVNHASPLGIDVPISYSAVRLGSVGPVLVVGRDLSMVSAMQQRLVHAQAEMERDYWQRRQSETRYQLLFQIATDPVLVVDAATFNVVDANRAAARMFAQPVDQLIGRLASAPLHEASRDALHDLFAAAKSSGRAVDGDAVLAALHRQVRVTVTPLRTESGTVLLMRLRASVPDWQVPDAQQRLLALMALSPDAIVVADGDGRVRMANPAFATLAGVDPADSAIGQPLNRWLGVRTDDLAALMARLRREIACTRVGTAVRTDAGLMTGVDLSGACLAEADDEAFGFILRPTASAAAVAAGAGDHPEPPLH